MISINKTTPHLKTKSYSLTIAATDNGTPRLATMHTLTIQIDSVGSKISVFNQSLYEIHVKEDNDVGTLVLMFPDVQRWNGKFGKNCSCFIFMLGTFRNLLRIPKSQTKMP